MSKMKFLQVCHLHMYSSCTLDPMHQKFALCMDQYYTCLLLHLSSGEEYENLEVSVQSHEEETKDFSMTENSAYGDSHVTASSGDGLLTSKDGERDVVMVNNNAYGSLNEPPN